MDNHIIPQGKHNYMELLAKIAELESTLAQKQLHVERLLRICRERANADRHIRPKKTSSGYVLISSVQSKQKLMSPKSAMDAVLKKQGPKKNKFTNVYRTLLQTPYDYQMQYGLVEEKVIADLDKSLMPALGILHRQTTEHNGEYRTWDTEDHGICSEVNGIYNWTLICKPPLWQVCIYHTLPIDIIRGNYL